MVRRGGRIRAWTAALRGELEGVRTELADSWTTSFEELRRDVVTEREAIDGRIFEHDLELVNALHRVAESFERIAENLESDRRDRQVQLDAVEFLMREMVLGTAHPTAVSPAVLGGTIDSVALVGGVEHDVDIDLSEAPLRVGTLVEVRSRFHDHWVHGFAITEYIPGPARRGYRLRRHTDTEPLPLLFDAADVRRAIAAPGDRSVEPVEEPEPSMWR